MKDIERQLDLMTTAIEQRHKDRMDEIDYLLLMSERLESYYRQDLEDLKDRLDAVEDQLDYDPDNEDDQSLINHFIDYQENCDLGEPYEGKGVSAND